MKEWICHDWLHRTSPERFSAGIQSGQLEHLTDFLTRELSVLGKKSQFDDHILSVWPRPGQTLKDLRPVLKKPVLKHLSPYLRPKPGQKIQIGTGKTCSLVTKNFR